ncbi:MAG: hypothetical protein GC154_20375 [bacterium]|nr:hypothetical protein [bacterium]
MEGYRLDACEVMFNHYGDRGVVDVALRKEDPVKRLMEWLICEMKPWLADVGEAIRQVRRAQEYFCLSRPDFARKGWVNQYRFLLVLEANDQNAAQVQQYRDLFHGMEIAWHHQDEALRRRILYRIEIDDAVSSIQRVISCA